MSAPSISARPSEAAWKKIERIAAEMNVSPGQLLLACADATIAMIESLEPRVPRLVTAARVLRANHATFVDEERAFSDTRTVVLIERDEPKSGTRDRARKGHRSSDTPTQKAT